MNQVLEGQPLDRFAEWKTTVGLPAEFPSLQPTVEQSGQLWRPYFSPTHLPKVEEIIDRVSSPRADVLVNSGHGATTLSRYVYDQTEEKSIRRMVIPVRLAIGDESQLGQSSDLSFDETVRRQVARNMLLNPWGRVMDLLHYARLIGVEGEFEDKKTAWGIRLPVPVQKEVDLAIEKRRRVLTFATSIDLDSPRQIDWELVAQYAPKLALPVVELLAGITQYSDQNYAARSISVSLQVDLSSDLARKDSSKYEQLVMNLLGNIDELQQKYSQFSRRVKDGRLIYLRELYFVSPEQYPIVVNMRGVTRGIVYYPGYRPLDIFAMLVNNYPSLVSQLNRNNPYNLEESKEIRVVRPHLAALVDPEFLLIPSVYDPRTPLSQIVSNFGDQLRIAAEAGPHTSYQLSLTPDQKRQFDQSRDSAASN